MRSGAWDLKSEKLEAKTVYLQKVGIRKTQITTKDVHRLILVLYEQTLPKDFQIPPLKWPKRVLLFFIKVIPLKLFYYQTFFETWPD